jgi:hypothetical protein
MRDDRRSDRFIDAIEEYVSRKLLLQVDRHLETVRSLTDHFGKGTGCSGPPSEDEIPSPRQKPHNPSHCPKTPARQFGCCGAAQRFVLHILLSYFMCAQNHACRLWHHTVPHSPDDA